jgi:predicted lipid-binding transport protein (Tim44 family)
MTKWLIALCIAIVGGTLAVPQADAAKLGGSRSVGTQRSITNTPPASAPAKPAQQTQNAAPAQGAAAQPAPAPSGFARWAPMLGGLALGGLLGSMFGSQLGGLLGGLLPVLLIGLLVVVAVVAVRAFMRRGEPASQPMRLAGMGGEHVSAPPPSQMSGFDARPQAASAAPVAAANIPSGFDVAGFLRGAKMNYVRMQVANDAGNVEEIRELTTPELFEDLKRDIVSRGGAAQQTDVVTLEADVLDVATEGNRYWASVRFSGMVRETPGTAPVAFEEIWNLAKPVDGSSGWLLAGIQQIA